jgi:uncharacterized RDD family membrane protein YckC
VDIIEKIISFLLGVLGSVLANELKDWTPWLTERLVRFSAARLPRTRRSRFLEEWQSHLYDVPGDAAKLLVAIDCVRAAILMSLMLGIAREWDIFSGRARRRPAPAVPISIEGIVHDARVALPVHRTIAAAIDAALVLFGVVVFLGGAYAAFGEDFFRTVPRMFFIFVVAMVSILYRSLWCICGRDTVGMRFAGLRLVDFDGRSPSPRRRFLRQVTGLLGLSSAGVGLAWALVDEEMLTWHDHISRTFPTPL